MNTKIHIKYIKIIKKNQIQIAKPYSIFVGEMLSQDMRREGKSGKLPGVGGIGHQMLEFVTITSSRQ